MNPETVSPGAAASNDYTYFAFISYKHDDEHWARWLKRNLQLYRLPATTHKKHPQLEKRCSPVFLDKTNLTPGLLDSGLSSEVQAARFLIVICSRKAAENSRYLDDELRYFLEGSGELTRVIPFIVDKSDHPVEECFPAYLAELCREKDIVGVSIHDDGKRSALLRLVAAMLGIKREELESDDRRRQRKQRLTALFLALLLAAGAWKAFDYFYPKTAYYVDYTEVYGVPKGIGELGKNDIKSMNAHYTLISSRGKLRELRYENAAGKLMPEDDARHTERFSRAEYIYAGNELSSVNQYNENESLIGELHYFSRNTIDLVRSPEREGEGFSVAAPLPAHITAEPLSDSAEQENRSNVIRYLVSYDPSGYVSEIRYCSDHYNRFGQDADGISGVRYERDEQGRILRQFYLFFDSSFGLDATRADSYRVIGKRNGEAGAAFVYDEHNDCVERRVLNAEGNPVTDVSQGAVTLYAYINHNEVRRNCYDAQGEPFLTDEGYAGRETAYDAHGNATRVSFFGTDGEPVLHRDGIAGWESAYDGRGDETLRSFFGVEGEPVLHEYGFAATELAYDERGNLTHVRFFDLDGEPILCRDGYAGWDCAYDERGRLLCARYFGLDGEPILCKEGYAEWAYTYDERGNLVRVGFFDADGRLSPCADGVAGWDAVFDERGNELKRSFFGPDGKPAAIREGYAGWESVFDGSGHETQRRLLDAAGKPALLSNGVSGWEVVYDERGNETEHRFFGEGGEALVYSEAFIYDEQGNLVKVSFFSPDGQLMLREDGAAGWTSVYDERGNELRRSYFDTAGLPVLNAEGVAGEAFAYDERGNLIKVSFFGTDGQPILHADGVAGWTSAYDERGNELRRGYFGLHGEPVLYAEGYAGLEAEYDERGNEIKRSYPGPDGKLILAKVGFAGVVSVYDEHDRIVRTSIFGTDGQPILSNYGSAGIESVYDERGNEIRVNYFGLHGEPVLNADNFASLEAEYDAHGNNIKISYLGLDGQLTTNSGGYAVSEIDYDVYGNRTAERFYSQSGWLLGSIELGRDGNVIQAS